MKTALPLCLALIAAAAPAAADEPVPEPIRLQVGCFKVTYRFIEPGRPTFTISDAKEWIQLAEREGGWQLTHVGIVGKEPMLHFKEYWTKLSDGSWRLGVYGRDDSPRYLCESRFVRNRFQCRAPGAVKPMRDDKRADYDKLDRGIALLMLPQRWVQQEANDKVKKDGSLVAIEAGLVEYDRLDDKKCEAAHKQFPQPKP
jgi:hypothetical protein